MNKERIEEYRKIIEESNVIFLPFTGDIELMEVSSDKRIINKYELKRKYPAYTFITRDFKVDNTEGYLLVSKHYLRENVPSLMRAKTSELNENAENMMGVLMTKIRKIKNN
jgi:hypothetical protein